MNYKTFFIVPLAFVLGSCGPSVTVTQTPTRRITAEVGDEKAVYTVTPVGKSKSVREDRRKFYDHYKDRELDVDCRPAHPADKQYSNCVFILHSGQPPQVKLPGHRYLYPHEPEAQERQKEFEDVLAEKERQEGKK